MLCITGKVYVWKPTKQYITPDLMDWHSAYIYIIFEHHKYIFWVGENYVRFVHTERAVILEIENQRISIPTQPWILTSKGALYEQTVVREVEAPELTFTLELSVYACDDDPALCSRLEQKSALRRITWLQYFVKMTWCAYFWERVQLHITEVL